MSTTAEPRVETVKFPTLEEFEGQFLEPLNVMQGELDGLAAKFRSIVGQIPTELWYARLVEPPTLENLGALTVFLDDVDMQLESMQEDVRAIRQTRLALDSLRREGFVREDEAPDA